MTYYASKELIDRASACMSDFLDSRIPESPIVLLSDIAKAEPLKEPRSTGALLEAAKDVRQRWRVSQRLDRDYDDDAIHSLSIAIEAEEQRGPSARDRNIDAIYAARDQRDTAMKEIEQLRKERDEALEPLSVDVGGEVLVLARHEAVEKIRDLAARAEKAEASADDKLRKLRGEVSSLRVIAMNTDPTSYTQAQRSQLAGRIAAYSQCISEVDRLLANPPSDVASVDLGDNPTLDAVCAVLGADVDSVEAQSAMLIEQARRVRPLEIAALDAMGWLRARLAESIGSSAVRESIAECADRIWSLVSDGAKDRWPCHPPGVDSSVEPVDVVDECDEHALPKDPPPSPPA
jgi:hypothetical protein